MKLIKSVRLTNNSRVDVEKWTRGGKLSPATYIIRKNGCRITPYEQRKLGLGFALDGLFTLTYGDLVGRVLTEPYGFFKRIPKDNTWDTEPTVIPFNLGDE